jgi:hypothetical protein
VDIVSRAGAVSSWVLKTRSLPIFSASRFQICFPKDNQDTMQHSCATQDETAVFMLLRQAFQMNLQGVDGRSQMKSGFSGQRTVKFHPSVKSFTLQCKIGPSFS